MWGEAGPAFCSHGTNREQSPIGSSGCRNKYHHRGLLPIWRLEVQGQGATGWVSPEASLLGFRQLPSPSVFTGPSLCVRRCPDLFIWGCRSLWIRVHLNYLNLT